MEDPAELGRYKVAVDMIKAVAGNCLIGIQGVYTFIWSKTALLVTKATEAARTRAGAEKTGRGRAHCRSADDRATEGGAPDASDHAVPLLPLRWK